jgi:hypothetical protein
MERMCFFVEGQTERIFVERLVREMAGQRNVHIDAVQAFGGGKLLPRIWEEIHATRPDPQTEYYVLINECMQDSRVLTDIRDQYPSLSAQQFSPIVGIRDVYPLDFKDIPTIRADFTRFVPSGPVVFELILGIMEIEAWFIAEHTHFARMHANLTHPTICGKLGYDPSTHDVTTIAHPCSDLRAVYGLVGLGYGKSRRHVERTVNELFYEQIYVSVKPRIADLNRLIDIIDAFFLR